MSNDNNNANDNDSENENNSQSLLKKKRKIMPTCQLCKINESKYVCPRCQYKTCSVQCVKEHKKKFYCSGLKDKYKKVNGQKDFTEKAFYRDINYLSSTISDINTSNKKVFSLFENNANHKDEEKKQASKTQRNFKRILKKFRGVTLHKCPEYFQRAKENKSHLDSTTKKIYWTIKFTFMDWPNCEQLFTKIQFDDEETGIKDIVAYLNNHKNEVNNAEVLSKINEVNWESNFNVYLKINTDSLDVIDKANYYCYNKHYYKQCDIVSQLKDVIKDQNIFEYPEFYLKLKG